MICWVRDMTSVEYPLPAQVNVTLTCSVVFPSIKKRLAIFYFLVEEMSSTTSDIRASCAAAHGNLLPSTWNELTHRLPLRHFSLTNLLNLVFRINETHKHIRIPSEIGIC
jgi:hypothetical protein